KVRGCASQVWLVTEPQSGGGIAFRGDSDAHIVRGLIAILLRLYSGRSPAEILAFDARPVIAAVERPGLDGGADPAGRGDGASRLGAGLGRADAGGHRVLHADQR